MASAIWWRRFDVRPGNHQVGGRLVHAFLHDVSHCTHQGQLADPLRLMIVGRPSVPSVPGQRLRCQRRANHPDPVRTAHLHGGEPGSVAKARTAARGRAPRYQGDTVTSPASGASSAADLPDYAPIPRSALGPALNDQGYYVGRVERNLYWVTDGVYQSAFLTTPDGVVLFDAPPSIGGNLRRAVDQITAAEGVSNTVTHLVYSHHHADHAGAASLFDSNVIRVGHEETRRLLLRDNDPPRPVPDVTFAARYTLEAAGERVELACHGPNHSPANTYIPFPAHHPLLFPHPLTSTPPRRPRPRRCCACSEGSACRATPARHAPGARARCGPRAGWTGKSCWAPRQPIPRPGSRRPGAYARADRRLRARSGPVRRRG